jgi:anti-anti-sigma regulatory factor
MTKSRNNAPRKPGKARTAGVAATAAPAPAVTAVDLGSSCTLTDVAALRAACIAALEAHDPPAIDGTQVERVDAAGIQVLVGFTIDCMERSINFSWVGRSPSLAHAIRLLGVDALLESPGVATPMGGMA